MDYQRFEDAYRAGYPQTIKFLRALPDVRLRDPEEIAQAAWVRGFERLHQLRDEKRIIAWVNSIARNLSLSMFRREQRMGRLEEWKPAAVSPINVTSIDLRRKLPACHPRQIYLLKRVHIYGDLPETLAEKSGVSVNAIHKALGRGRRALREKLSPARVGQRIVRDSDQRKRKANGASNDAHCDGTRSRE